MQFIHDDGGRAAAGYKGNAGDCVTRTIAIATGKPYAEVYLAMGKGLLSDRRTRRRRNSTSPRDGVPRRVYERYLLTNGFRRRTKGHRDGRQGHGRP